MMFSFNNHQVTQYFVMARCVTESKYQNNQKYKTLFFSFGWAFTALTPQASKIPNYLIHYDVSTTQLHSTIYKGDDCHFS